MLSKKLVPSDEIRGEKIWIKGSRATSQMSQAPSSQWLILLDIKKKLFTMRAVRQVAQRSCGSPIIGSTQSQAGCSLELPDLVKGVLQPSSTKTLPRKSHTEMDYEATASTEQSLTLPVAPRSKAEIIHTVKQHRVSSSSQWVEAGEGILK